MNIRSGQMARRYICKIVTVLPDAREERHDRTWRTNQ